MFQNVLKRIRQEAAATASDGASATAPAVAPARPTPMISLPQPLAGDSTGGSSSAQPAAPVDAQNAENVFPDYEADKNSSSSDDEKQHRETEPLREPRSPAPPEHRVRRRSTSRPGPARYRTQCSAPGEIDLTMHVSAKKLRQLTEQQKDTLREVVRKHDRQTHLSDYWQGRSRWRLRLPQEPQEAARRRDRDREKLLHELAQWADPIPDAREFITGIPSMNAKYQDVLQYVVRAVASRKVH